MYPRWHIFYGALFTLLLAIVAQGMYWGYLALVFLASIFIDFDHYLCAVWKTGQWGFRNALEYHTKHLAGLYARERKGFKTKSDFHLFHTLEFHALIGLLGMLWLGFFYLFIGMVFHSLLDVIDGVRKNTLHRREFFFFNWVRKRV